jgi:Protein of unknown function (DUF4054)
VTPSDFQSAFPDGEFNALVPTYIQKFLDAAAPMFDVAAWGNLYSEGLAMYVADRIVQSKARAARGIAQINGGATTEKHVGPVGASFDSEILNRQAVDTVMVTDYGRRYAELRDMVGLGGTACGAYVPTFGGLPDEGGL